MAQELHHIVVVGGGAGGLELVTRLGNSLGKQAKAKITLVDQNLTHVWKPLLHEIAAGTLDPYSEEVNYFAHAARHHYQFVSGSLCNVLPEKKQIQLCSATGKNLKTLSYDTLVLAVGSVSNDFNTEGAKEYCYFLDNRAQADQFQKDLLNTYLDAQYSQQPNHLNIAIIGAGATGVELASQLVEAKENFYRYGLNHIHPDLVKITLIEAADRILPALPEKVAENTLRQIKTLGIEVLTGHKVQHVAKDHISFQDGSALQTDLNIWAAGIKAPQVIEQLEGFEKDHLNRIKVYATLQTYSYPDIFAFGDCAHCQLEAGQPPLGPRAQVASQQANFLVRALTARIAERPIPMFHFSDKGSLISLSQNKAVGQLLGQINVQGSVAKGLYISLYRLHQANIYGYSQAGALTVRDFVTRRIRPQIKLH